MLVANEFKEWLRFENLSPDNPQFRFRLGFLLQERSDQLTPPGLIYMTDLAFPEDLAESHDAKKEWIRGLQDIELTENDFAYLLPPVCFSTGKMSGDMMWYDRGKQLADEADNVPVPVFILGPSPRLNGAEDEKFPTKLPAGYPFCVHYLTDGRKRQAISIPGGAGGSSDGRLRVIGRGSLNYEETLEEVIWGMPQGESYCLAADYYLYLIMLLYGTAKWKGGVQDVNAVDFYSFFHQRMVRLHPWESSSILNKAIIGNDALRFRTESFDPLTDTAKPLLERDPQDGREKDYPLSNVMIKFSGSGNGDWRTYDNIGWFEQVRKKLRLK